jgi:hypothetical protein
MCTQEHLSEIDYVKSLVSGSIMVPTHLLLEVNSGPLQPHCRQALKAAAFLFYCMESLRLLGVLPHVG